MRLFPYFTTVPSRDFYENRHSLRAALHSFMTFFIVSCPDEKDDLTASLKDSNRLVEEAKQREVQMQSKIDSMDQQVNVLTDRDQEVCCIFCLDKRLNFFLK